MINGASVLAIIPARGGSKRAPYKNLREFRGRVLFAWSYDAACASQYVDRIILSTEDKQIRIAARSLGIRVLDRPDELASDNALNEDVLRHALGFFPAEWVVLLQPTSPLRTTEDIDRCLEIAQASDGCVSFCENTGMKNGAVYVARASWLLAGNDFFQPFPVRYLMPAERSLDIDLPSDFL